MALDGAEERRQEYCNDQWCRQRASVCVGSSVKDTLHQSAAREAKGAAGAEHRRQEQPRGRSCPKCRVGKRLPPVDGATCCSCELMRSQLPCSPRDDALSRRYTYRRTNSAPGRCCNICTSTTFVVRSHKREHTSLRRVRQGLQEPTVLLTLLKPPD